MAKAIFSGSISFGLVNIPVKVYPAVKDKRVAFRTLHKECHTPLIHKRWCPTCNREVRLEEVEKGYQLSKDRFVVLTDEELERVQLKTLKVLEIIGFVDAAEIDPLYYDFPYLLEPQEGGEKAYTLLREILSQTGKVAIGRVVMRNKEYVVVLRPYQKALLMVTLHYHDEIVSPEELENLKKVVVVREQELKMGQLLIQQLVGEFKPEEFKDRYREAVMELVRKKAEGEVIPVARVKEVEATVDLMKALEASLQQLKKKKEAEATATTA
jgi:DNA end-binding protein Ku